MPALATTPGSFHYKSYVGGIVLAAKLEYRRAIRRGVRDSCFSPTAPSDSSFQFSLPSSRREKSSTSVSSSGALALSSRRNGALTHGVALGHRQTTALPGLEILCASFHGSGSGPPSGGSASCNFQRGPVRRYIGLVTHSHDRERDGFSAFCEIEHDHVGVVDDR
jgi:hypothetical protein